MNQPRWTEALEGDGSSLEIVVEGVDADRSELQEMESFRRALSAPAKEHDVVVKDAHGNVRSSSAGMLRVVRGIVRLAITVGFLAMLATLTELLQLKLSGEVWLTIALLALFGPLIFSGIRWLQRRRKLEKVRDRFTLTLDDGGFRLKGSTSSRTHPLDAIERFEGERRLVLLTKDGKRDNLPVALGARDDHIALAERLNEALVHVRASRGGYRGAGPRVELREASDAEPVDVTSASDPRAAPPTDPTPPAPAGRRGARDG